MIASLMSGLLLGIAAGMSPGALTALVITETLKHSRIEGIKVAIAPLITDLPIVIVSVLLLAQLESNDFILGIIALAGALFISKLALENLKAPALQLNKTSTPPKSLRKGVIVNLLNPHPYLFWIAVGAPIVVKALEVSVLAAAAFVFGFYICLVGSKLVLALVVEHAKGRLNEAWYRYILRALGVALLIFAVLFVREGFKLLF